MWWKPTSRFQAMRAIGPDGKSSPGQIVSTANGTTKVLFLAKLPSFGYAVYDLQPTESAAAGDATLKVAVSSLENARYRLKIDENGDVSSLFDKSIGKELLSAPISLAISTDKPVQWPAWNMDWKDQQRAPRAYVQANGPIKVEEFAGLAPGFIKPAPVAWYASHRHASDGSNEAYQYSYLFAYRLDLPAGASTLKLPNDKDLRILSVSVAREAGEIHPAQPLYDTLQQNSPSEAHNQL